MGLVHADYGVARRHRAHRTAASRDAYRLAKRALRGIKLVSLKSPDDLGEARALLAEHADSHDDHHAPDWRLLVAPVAGTFRAPDGHPASAGPGTHVGDRTDLGHVEARGGNNAVTTAFPATVIEWLVEDGDPVSAGQPLLRLQPAEAAAAQAARAAELTLDQTAQTAQRNQPRESERQQGKCDSPKANRARGYLLSAATSPHG